MSWWETLHLVTWWKRLGISAIKTGQDAPSWIWCTERLSFFGGGHIVLQRFVHVRCHFQPLPTKLVFAYFDRGSYVANVCHPCKQDVFSRQWCRWCDLYIMFSFVLAIPNASSLPGKQFPAKCLQPAGWLRAAVNWIELDDSKGILMIPLGKFLWNLPFVTCKYMFCLFVPSISFHRLALH